MRTTGVHDVDATWKAALKTRTRTQRMYVGVHLPWVISYGAVRGLLVTSFQTDHDYHLP